MNKKNKIKDVHDSLSERYDKVILNDHWRYYSDLSRYLIKDETRKTDVVVLDAGGATGAITIPTKEDWQQLIIYDISNGMIEKGKASNKDCKVSFVCGDLENMKEVASGSIDFIVCIGAVLSITPNPQKVLGEFKRILKNNGHCFLSVLNKNYYTFYMPSLNMIAKFTSNGILHPMFYPAEDLQLANQTYSPNEFEKMLNESGFILDKYGSYPLFEGKNMNLDEDRNSIYEFEKKFCWNSEVKFWGKYLLAVVHKECFEN